MQVTISSITTYSGERDCSAIRRHLGKVGELKSLILFILFQ